MTRTPNTDYTKVGDSAFTNGNVISYEGKTYFSINDTGPKKYTKTLSPSNTEKKEQNT